jgi:hypothetical protein
MPTTNNVYADIALDFRDTNRALISGLTSTRPQKQGTPFLDYQAEAEKKRKQQEEEESRKKEGETSGIPDTFKKVAGIDIPDFGASDTVTAPYTPKLADKSKKERQKKLLHSMPGLPVEEWGRLDKKSQSELLGNSSLRETTRGTVYAVDNKPSSLSKALSGESWIPESITKESETTQKIGRTLDPVLFNIGGTDIKATDIAGLGLLAYGGYQALSTAIPATYRAVVQGGVGRAFDSWAKSAGKTFPKETRDSFVSVLTEAGVKMKVPGFSKNAIQSWFKPTKAGAFVATPEAQTATDQAMTSLVKQYEPILTKFTQTNTAVPGQTQTLSQILQAISGKVPQTAQAVQAGRMQLTPEGQAPKAEGGTLNAQAGLDAYGKAVSPVKKTRAKSTTPKVLTSAQQTQVKAAEQAADIETPVPVQPQPVAPATQEAVTPPAVPPAQPPAPPQQPTPIPQQPTKPFKGVVISQVPELEMRVWNQTIPGKAGKILETPGIKQVARIINPLAVSNEPGTTLSAMSGMIDDQITGGTSLIMADPVRQFEKARAAFVLKDGQSLAKNISQVKPLPNGTQSNSIHDMIEYAPWYDFGTGTVGDARRKAIQAIRDTSEQMSQMLKNEGILVDAPPGVRLQPGQIRAMRGESGWTFLHRVVTEIKEEMADTLAKKLQQSLTASGINFPKAQNENNYMYLSRFAQQVTNGQIMPNDQINTLLTDYANIADVKVKKTTLDAKRSWKTVADGMKAGVTYEADPLKELNKQVRGSYELVKKKRLAEAVKDLLQTTTPSEKAITELGYTEDTFATFNKQYDRAKALKKALSRAIRGERLPAPTLSSIGESYPDEVKELKRLIAKFQENPIPETGDEVKALEARINGIIDKNAQTATDFNKLRSQYSERMGATGTVEYGKVPGLPGLGGRVIAPQDNKMGQEIADELRQHFGYMPKSGADKALEVTGKVGAVMRMFRLGFDLSATTIQQAMSLGYDIKNLVSARPSAVWARATGGAVKELFNKDTTHLQDFLIKHTDSVKDLIERGGLIESAEFTEGAEPIKTLIEKLPRGSEPISKIADIISKHIVGRSDAIFSTARIEAAVYMYEAGKVSAGKAGKLDEWARAVNRMTGVLSTRAMGISPGQRSIESTLGFLSPRFTRANAGIFADIVRNPRSYTAKQALASLAALIGAVTAIYYGVNKSQGKDVTLNPFDRNYGNVVIGNHTYRFGGIMADVRRLMAVIDSLVYNASGKHASLSGKEDNTQPLDRLIFQQFQGKSAPITGTSIDVTRMMTDKNARDWEGQPLSWKNIIGNWLTPSWTDTLINEGVNVDSLMATSGEIVGLTTNEIDLPYEMSLKWRDDFKEYLAIPTDSDVVKAKKLVSRDKYRETNPIIDAKLFVSGQVSTVKTASAVQQVLKIIKENDIDPDSIKGVQANKEQTAKRKELGYKDTEITMTDRLVMLLESDTEKTEATPATKTTTPATSLKWEMINTDPVIVKALNKVWFQGGTLTPDEEKKLKALYEKYPMGQTSFTAWYKQGLRQLLDKWIAETKIK